MQPQPKVNKSMRINKDFELAGIGVGPGNEQYLTLEAYRILKSVDIIFAPTTKTNSVGYAQTIINKLKIKTEVRKSPIDIYKDPENSYQKCAKEIVKAIKEDKKCAFITLGDPCLYSTFSGIRNHVLNLRKKTKILLVPGITAFQALLCATLSDGALKGEKIRILPSHITEKDLEDALGETDSSIILYKCSLKGDSIIDLLSKNKRLEGAIYGEYLGMENEKIIVLNNKSLFEVPYFSTIFIPAVRTKPR